MSRRPSKKIGVKEKNWQNFVVFKVWSTNKKLKNFKIWLEVFAKIFKPLKEKIKEKNENEKRVWNSNANETSLV